MVLESKVSISIMFQGFLSFDIPIVLKYMFLTCFYHVFYMNLLAFPISIPPKNRFCIMYLQHLCHYILFQLCITSFYNFFFCVSKILIFYYSSSFVKHGLYGFDKVFTMLPCFRGFKTC